jgi:sulfatase modifying factor 1
MAGSSQRRLLAEFVAVTGYVTTAERPLDPGLARWCSLRPPVPMDLRGWSAWWIWVPGESWRRPRGPGTDLTGLAWGPEMN